MNRNSRDDQSKKPGRTYNSAKDTSSNNNRSKTNKPKKVTAGKNNSFDAGSDSRLSSYSRIRNDETENRKRTTTPRFADKAGAGDEKPDHRKPSGRVYSSKSKPDNTKRRSAPSENYREPNRKVSSANKRFPEKPFYKPRPVNTYRGTGDKNEQADDRKRKERLPSTRTTSNTSAKDPDRIRLNRYIANAGICSRRKADELIQAGVVSVNGEVITELGSTVDPRKDLVRYNGETLKREKNIYVLLNKPKDYITTTDDPQERKTVMQLVERSSSERIYPVGRLDRNTTGLLLMTNDGDLAEKLSHPRNNIIKIYNVELNKNLIQGDLNKIVYGLELEDGFIKPDVVSYVQGGSKRDIGIQIHGGKNRIVRRIFEHLGYDVVKLDRVIYANLTKKDLPRGRWRYLEEKEVIQLKYLIK